MQFINDQVWEVQGTLYTDETNATAAAEQLGVEAVLRLDLRKVDLDLDPDAPLDTVDAVTTFEAIHRALYDAPEGMELAIVHALRPLMADYGVFLSQDGYWVVTREAEN